MNTRFKANNFIAILIAVMLIFIGFALGFIHQQMESDEEQNKEGFPVAVLDERPAPVLVHAESELFNG
jgi:uncharacterized membrane protein